MRILTLGVMLILAAAAIAGCAAPPEAPAASATPAAATSTAAPTVTPTFFINLAIPDTKTLTVSPALSVYVHGGRMCMLPFTGQPPIALAEASGAVRAAVSDDGKWVAYSRWLPRWSDRLSQGEVAETLWVIRPDGTGAKQLLDSAQLADSVPDVARYEEFPEFSWQWLPGTHQIILTSGASEVYAYTSTGAAPVNDDLVRVDADSGDIATLVPAGHGGSLVLPSPDGKHIAMLRWRATLTEDTISLVASDGSDLREAAFTYPTVATGGDAGASAQPAWLPDSGGLWVALPPDGKDTPARLWRLDAGGKSTLAQTLPIIPEGTEFIAAAPDGQHVAFAGALGGQSGLHIIRTAGGQEVAFVSDISAADWLPDSQHLRYDERDVSMIAGLTPGDIHPEYPAVPDQTCGPG